MRKKSTYSQKKADKGYEVFLVVYALFVIIPAIIMTSGEQAWINIALSAGLVILVLFYYFDKTFSTSVSWGMKALFKSQQDEKYAITFQRTHFWKETDIALSFDIKPFLKEKAEEVAAMSKLGSRMRILLLDPESKYARLVEEQCGMQHGEYAYYALQVMNLRTRVQQSSVLEKDFIKIEIKFYDAMPIDNIFRAYDCLYAYDNKQNSANDFTSYSYPKDSNGFNFYKAMFDEKWNDEKFSYEKEITVDMVPNFRKFSEMDTVVYHV